MLKWISGIVFVIVVIFTSVVVVENHQLLEQLIKQSNQQTEVVAVKEKAEERKVQQALTWIEELGQQKEEVKKREAQRVITRLERDTRQKLKRAKKLNDLQRAYQEAKTDADRTRLLRELVNARAESRRAWEKKQ